MEYDDEASEVISKLMDYLEKYLDPDQMEAVNQILASGDGETDADRIGEKQRTRRGSSGRRPGAYGADDRAIRRRPMSAIDRGGYLGDVPECGSARNERCHETGAGANTDGLSSRRNVPHWLTRSSRRRRAMPGGWHWNRPSRRRTPSSRAIGAVEAAEAALRPRRRMRSSTCVDKAMGKLGRRRCQSARRGRR